MALTSYGLNTIYLDPYGFGPSPKLDNRVGRQPYRRPSLSTSINKEELLLEEAKHVREVEENLAQRAEH